MSESVSFTFNALLETGVLSGTGKPTASFPEKMDKLFDGLNSSTVANQPDGKQWMRDLNTSPPCRNPCHRLKAGSFWFPAATHNLWVAHYYNGCSSVGKAPEGLTSAFSWFGGCGLTKPWKPFRLIPLNHDCKENRTFLQFIARLKHICAGRLFKLFPQGNCELD